MLISEVKENTYYAELHLHRDDHIIHIDARPSDSIAVALRLNAPIFTQDTLLELTAIDTVDAIGPDAESVDTESLKSYLEKLDPEDFGKFTP